MNDMRTLAILITIGFSCLGVLGDSFLELATISVVYSVSMVLLSTAIGIIFLEERLGVAEVAGCVMAVASLVLLVRFA